MPWKKKIMFSKEIAFKSRKMGKSGGTIAFYSRKYII